VTVARTIRPMSVAESSEVEARWLGPGVAGVGTASFLADAGHEIPTALLPSLLTSTLGAPASALGAIEGVSDALAGMALADDPERRRTSPAESGGPNRSRVAGGLVGFALGPNRP